MPENPLKEKDQNKNMTEEDKKDSIAEVDVKKEVPPEAKLQNEVPGTRGIENVPEEKSSEDSTKREQAKPQEKREPLTLVVPEDDKATAVSPISTSPISPTKPSTEVQTPTSQSKNFFKKFGLKKTKNQDPSSPITEVPVAADVSATSTKSPDSNVEPTTEEVTKVNVTEAVTENNVESKNFFKKKFRKASLAKNQEPQSPLEVPDTEVSAAQTKPLDSIVESTTEEVVKTKNVTETATENDTESKNFFKKFGLKKSSTKNQELSNPPEAHATDLPTKSPDLKAEEIVEPATEETTKSETKSEDAIENEAESKNFFKKFSLAKKSSKNHDQSPPNSENSTTDVSAAQTKSPDPTPEVLVANATDVVDEPEAATGNEAESKEAKTEEKNKFSFVNVGKFIVDRIREEFDELDRRMYRDSEERGPSEASEISERDELLANATSAPPESNSSNPSNPRNPVNPVANGTKGALAEVGDALNERGEKIAMVDEQMAEMASNANTFAALAKELAQAQKNKKWYQL